MKAIAAPTAEGVALTYPALLNKEITKHRTETRKAKVGNTFVEVDGVRVLKPVYEDVLVQIPYTELVQETEDEALARCMQTIGGGEVVDLTALPASREFRSAWARGSGRVVVDMPKARAAHMARIRTARNAELVVADGEAAAANDSNDPDKIAKAKKKRQDLRDAPAAVQPEVDAAATPEELSAIWPNGVKRQRS